MKNRWISLALAGAMAVTLAVLSWDARGRQSQEMAFPAFMEAVAQGEIRTATLSDGPTFQAATLDGRKLNVPNPRSENFKMELLMSGVRVEESGAGQVGLLLGCGLAVALAALLLKNRRGAAGFAKYAQMEDAKAVPDITFEQVAANQEALSSMRDLVDFIKSPEQFSNYGARIPRGVLLYGPPGTGKTLMARALAGEAKVPFFAVSGADFVQVYVGVGASRIRALFQKARKAGRAVVFIDEIDAIGKKRDNGNDEREQTLNALLTEMSGFSSADGVVVLAATNRLDTLDEALLRAGRFDRQIEVPLPDVRERKQILTVHGSRLPLDPSVDLGQLAAQTPYFSGARLESLMNEAAILAARRGEGKIGRQDVERAFSNVMVGQEKKERDVALREREITAAHEAGHAVATALLLPQSRLSRVSVIPSTKGAAGYSMTSPQDQMFYTRQELMGHMAVALAGRAAEEIAFGPDLVTTGAANDLEKAAQIALDMAARWGMGETMCIFGKEEQEKAAKTLAGQAYQTAKDLLRANRAAWERVKNLLLQKETLQGQEVYDAVLKTNAG